MSLVSTDLTAVQDKLHDSGVLWTRSELLKYYNDGYRDLFAKSKAYTRVVCLDVPGRFTYTHTYEWEDRHISGLIWLCAYQGYNRQYGTMYLWEVEHLEGVTPTNSNDGITQNWERCYSGVTDHHFVFGMRKDHGKFKRIAWDDKLLLPISVRELDQNDNAWMKRAGEPIWWSPGTGRARSIEVYEIRTDYQQGYEFIGYYDGGMPRSFSGTRSYSVTVDGGSISNAWAYTSSSEEAMFGTPVAPLLLGFAWRFTMKSALIAGMFTTQIWEKEMEDGITPLSAGALSGTFQWENQYGSTYVVFGLGTIRSITSPDRQYLPVLSGVALYAMLGIARDLTSSVMGLLIYEVVVPDQELTETDSPEMMPQQMQKYLRYFTLYRAFMKGGEGQKPELAQHYKARYDLGVNFFRKMADVTSSDIVTKRQPLEEVNGRPGRVRFPSSFERMS